MNLCRRYFHETGRTRLVTETVENINGNAAGSGRAAAGDITALEWRETDTTVQTMEELEQSRLLAEALLKIPDIQREAVLLHHFYGYKNREIARMTGASCAAVKSRVNQGLGKLQQLLDKEDFYG